MKKVALVLMGGGRFGAGQAAILYILSKLGFKPDFIVGASIGGINGATYSLHGSEALKNLWLNIKSNRDVYYGKMDIWGLIRCLISKGKSVLNPQPLYKIFKDNFEGHKLGELPVPLCLTGTNLTTKKKEIYFAEKGKEYDLVDVLKVTSGIPGLFPCPVFEKIVDGIKRKIIKCDGGVLNNTPVETAASLGATHVIVVRCSPENEPVEYFDNTAVKVIIALFKTLLKYPEEEMLEDVKEKYPNLKTLVLSPKKNKSNALDFEKGITEETFNAGLKIGQEQLSIEILDKFYNS